MSVIIIFGKLVKFEWQACGGIGAYFKKDVYINMSLLPLESVFIVNLFWTS